MSSPKFDASSGLTCIACRVLFADGAIQRDHYKSDWHRYNLKRKVAELPPVTAEQFELKAKSFVEKEVVSGRTFCKDCNKQFQSSNAYENHLNSKRHKENVVKVAALSEKNVGSADAKKVPMGTTNVVEKAAPLKGDTAAGVGVEDDVDEESDEGWVTDHGSDDESDDFDDSKALPSTVCLFCSSTSGSMEDNFTHMSIAHGFFLPDLEYCIDVAGMLRYLGLKIASGNICLLCNERKKRFRSMDACQKHMRDKAHCRVAHEISDMIEFEDFYDYSPMYPDGEDDDSSNVVIADEFSLTLPSGARVGHRSLMRYYRQHLRPVASEGTGKRKRDTMNKVIAAHYKALGWTGTSGALAVQHARDIRFMKHLDAKQWTRLGVHSNKLFKSLGRRDQQ